MSHVIQSGVAATVGDAEAGSDQLLRSHSKLLRKSSAATVTLVGWISSGHGRWSAFASSVLDAASICPQRCARAADSWWLRHDTEEWPPVRTATIRYSAPNLSGHHLTLLQISRHTAPTPLVFQFIKYIVSVGPITTVDRQRDEVIMGGDHQNWGKARRAKRVQ